MPQSDHYCHRCQAGALVPVEDGQVPFDLPVCTQCLGGQVQPKPDGYAGDCRDCANGTLVRALDGTPCGPFGETCRAGVCKTCDDEGENCCPSGETPCDDGFGGQGCCPSGTKCCFSTCIPTDELCCEDGSPTCQGQCCGPNQVCDDVVGCCTWCNGACCPAGQSCCGGVCVDLISDSDHCGACGNACGQCELCEGGACVPHHDICCPDGAQFCGVECCTAEQGGCCGNFCCCPPGQTPCDDGRCVPVGTICCPAGMADCGGGACVALKEDANNCGVCGRTCPDGEECCCGACWPVGFCCRGGNPETGECARCTTGGNPWHCGIHGGDGHAICCSSPCGG